VTVLGSYYLLKSLLCPEYYRLKIQYLRSPTIVAQHLKNKILVSVVVLFRSRSVFKRVIRRHPQFMLFLLAVSYLAGFQASSAV
jgi:hypothetical protein